MSILDKLEKALDLYLSKGQQFYIEARCDCGLVNRVYAYLPSSFGELTEFRVNCGCGAKICYRIMLNP